MLPIWVEWGGVEIGSGEDEGQAEIQEERVDPPEEM